LAIHSAGISRSITVPFGGTKKMHGRSFKDFPSLLVSISCILVVMLIGCSSSHELRSGWTDREVAITGDESHWKGATTEIVGPDVSVGVKNDGSNLYIGLITSNRATQFQILALGCTAWFDAEGGKNKIFGVQFPVSGLLQGRRLPAGDNAAEFQRLIDAAQRQLVIRGPGVGEQHRLSAQDASGVEARLGYIDGTLIYELKVPLRKSNEHPYAINADMTKPLLVGFETGDLAEAMKGQSGVSSPSQNAGGRGRTGSRTGGRAGGGTGQGLGGDAPEPLKHWITVQLSSGSTTQ
jgi:hypothetical protein